MGGDVHKKKKKHSSDEYHYKGKFNRECTREMSSIMHFFYALSFMH